MSSTLLNRAFGLRDYGYVKTVYKGSGVYFHIEDYHPHCGVCRSDDVARDGVYERTFRLPPVGLHPVFAVLPALSLNAPLAAAYYLKEDLRMLWLMSDLKSAKAWLRDWLKSAEASGIGQMKKMAATIRSHQGGGSWPSSPTT